MYNELNLEFFGGSLPIVTVEFGIPEDFTGLDGKGGATYGWPNEDGGWDAHAIYIGAYEPPLVPEEARLVPLHEMAHVAVHIKYGQGRQPRQALRQGVQPHWSHSRMARCRIVR